MGRGLLVGGGRTRLYCIVRRVLRGWKLPRRLGSEVESDCECSRRGTSTVLLDNPLQRRGLGCLRRLYRVQDRIPPPAI